jgi:hypothetical protein
VVRSGKNLLDTGTVSSGKGLTVTKNADGGIHVSGTPTGTWIDFNSAYNAYIPEGNYTLSLQSEIPCNFVLYSFYEGNTDRFTNVMTNGQKSKAVSFASNVDRIHIGLSGLNTSTAYDFTIYPQLEIGSAATDYEPYKGNTYSVNWETEAGTVYGGTLDIVSGKLTVLGTKDTVTIIDGQIKSQFFCESTGQSVTVLGDNVRITLNRIAQTSNMNTISSSYSIRMANLCPHYFAYNSDTAHWYINNLLYLYLPKVDVGETLESYKTFLQDNPFEVYIPFATPTEIQLTPQEIRTLLGENNIWSDGGDMEVEYPADTKTYIDTKIAEAVAAAMA